MCGIFCLISGKCPPNILHAQYKIFEENIRRRGPNSHNFEISESHCANQDILLAASVLWLQGSKICPQPLHKEEAYTFLYNGDVFGGQISEIDRQVTGDTIVLFDLLINSEDIPKTLESIQGPYAFIFLDVDQNLLYFGRDVYGRRSLLLGKKDDAVVIASVATRNTGYDFLELPSVGTFCLDLKSHKWKVFSWSRKNNNFTRKIEEVEHFLGSEIEVLACESNASIDFYLPSESDLKLIADLETNINPLEVLLNNSEWFNNVKTLSELLNNAVRKRIQAQTEFCQNCSKICRHCTTGILFSGGLDCAILALLADKYVSENRPVDLINVAFENNSAFGTPDRQTSLETLEELSKLCPERKWSFVNVDVSQNELQTMRKSRIADLIYPLNTILDDSLGCALWFAARAQTDNYTSTCRTLLVGMGADELFGGYSRHRAALKNRNWEHLQTVLDQDFENISFRNLARDDRVVSDHGRQLRTPYLDEDLVEFVRSLNCWEKTLPLPEMKQGIGEKILLRTLAWHLGLRNAATFQKRALQFGSRIANKKENGHDISQRLID